MTRFDLVSSTDDFDFDGMYEHSRQYIEAGNIKFPAYYSPNQRKEYFKRRTNEIIGDYFGSVFRDNHHDYVLTTGYKSGSTFHVGTGLIAPMNGSRSYIYTEWPAIWAQHLKDNGITDIVMNVPVNSNMPNMMKKCHINCDDPVHIADELQQKFKLG